MNPSKDIVNDHIDNTPKPCSSDPGNAYLFSPDDDFGASEIKSSWLQEAEYLNKVFETEDIFQGLADINPPTGLLQDINSTEESSKLKGDGQFVLHETCRGESSGSKSKVDDIDSIHKCQSGEKEEVAPRLIKNKKYNEKPKRTRSAEMHNISERRRRERINKKLRTLRQLVPHCYKPDKASILDDVIQYLKALQLQVEMMSCMVRRTTTTCQLASSSSPSVIDTENRHISHFPPFVPIPQRPTPMTMAAVYHPTGLHMTPSLPPPAYYASPSLMAGLHGMPLRGNLADVPQLHAPSPLIYSQVLGEATTNNNVVLPTFGTAGLSACTSTSANDPNQVASQTEPRGTAAHQFDQWPSDIPPEETS